MCARTASSMKRDRSPLRPPPWLARNIRSDWSVSAETATFQRMVFTAFSANRCLCVYTPITKGDAMVRKNLPFGVLVAPLRQRAQGRLVHLGEGAGAAARQLLEGPLVQVEQQGPQCAIELEIGRAHV